MRRPTASLISRSSSSKSLSQRRASHRFSVWREPFTSERIFSRDRAEAGTSAMSSGRGGRSETPISAVGQTHARFGPCRWDRHHRGSKTRSIMCGVVLAGAPMTLSRHERQLGLPACQWRLGQIPPHLSLPPLGIRSLSLSRDERREPMTDHTARTGLGVPEIVDRSAFQLALDALRVREKAHTREGDAIAAARRQLLHGRG